MICDQKLMTIDDVLRRLAPSLPQPHTCDVVDLNPGICLWSSRLHKILQPRRHVLVEPERDLYGNFIEPLLSKPQSAYRYAASITDVLAPSTGLLDALQPDNNSRARSALNKSLIVVANLTAKVEARRHQDSNYTGAMAKHMLYAFYGAMLLHPQESLHRYGLVRMLAWLPDEVKSSIIPRTVASRAKQSVQWDLVAGPKEIASGSSHLANPLWQQRHFELDVESKRLVSARRRPDLSDDLKERSPPPPEPAPVSYNLDTAGLEAMRKSLHRPVWTDELAELEEQYETGNVASKSKEEKRLRILRSKRVTQHNQHKRVLDIAQQQRTIDAAERALSSSSSSIGESDLSLEGTRELAATLNKEREKLPRHRRLALDKYVDDQRAFDHRPPVLAWDRREAEPLLVDRVEFVPQKPLALIDFQPDPFMMGRLDTTEKKMAFDEIVSTLFQQPGHTVYQALQSMVHDALPQFLERVPGLQDPLQGGKPDLRDVRIRSLPVNLFVDLALAWESWPFRTEALKWGQGQFAGQRFADG